MMTQTHILVSAAIWAPRIADTEVQNLDGESDIAGSDPAKPPMWATMVAAVAGGVIPDAAIFVLYAIEKAKGTAERAIWGEIYWQPYWQDMVAMGNSIPLYLGVFAVAWFSGLRLTGRQRYASQIVMVLALSCLAHVACDFPVHHDDAHRHLFPLSNFKFISPVSYWDPNHFGVQFSFVESMLGVGLAPFVWRRTNSWLAKLGIGVLATSYLALPAYFAYRFFACSG